MHPDANKFQIRNALKELFGVTATDVRTMRCAATDPAADAGVTARWKKAIVTLKDGDRRRVRGLR